MANANSMRWSLLLLTPSAAGCGAWTTPRLVATCGRRRLQTPWDVETTATAASLHALARRVQLLNTEIADHTRAITTLVRAWHPELLTSTGVGPIVAAVVLCAWSHPGRCRTEAAFAMLGGAAPIPASSGQRVRVRLNRSGDRHLNQALHVVVLTRLRYDPATRAYATRRRAEGKTNREIRRCLVRYVARQLYWLLEHGRAAGSAIAVGEVSPAHLAPRFERAFVACRRLDEQGSIRTPTPTP
jgi:transposase